MEIAGPVGSTFGHGNDVVNVVGPTQSNPAKGAAVALHLFNPQDISRRKLPFTSTAACRPYLSRQFGLLRVTSIPVADRRIGALTVGIAPNGSTTAILLLENRAASAPLQRCCPASFSVFCSPLLVLCLVDFFIGVVMLGISLVCTLYAPIVASVAFGYVAVPAWHVNHVCWQSVAYCCGMGLNNSQVRGWPRSNVRLATYNAAEHKVR